MICGARSPWSRAVAEQALCCSFSSRGKLCVAPFMCGANVILDNMCLNGDVSTKVTEVDVNILRYCIEMFFCLLLSCMQSLLQKL